MKNSMLKKTVVAAAMAMSFTSAQAYNIVWQLSPDANSLAFGQTVVTANNQINFLDTQTQAPGIYGAGFTYTGGPSFTMDFDSDLYTWDSYNAPTTAGTGYYDAFVVTVSTSGFYWNSSPADPITASASTFVWGGTNFADNQLESRSCNVNCQDMISLNGGNTTYYVSVVLDTSSLPQTDNLHPSWGSFHVTPVPEPEIYAMMAAGLGLMGFVARRRKKFEDAVV